MSKKEKKSENGLVDSSVKVASPKKVESKKNDAEATSPGHKTRAFRG